MFWFLSLPESFLCLHSNICFNDGNFATLAIHIGGCVKRIKKKFSSFSQGKGKRLELECSLVEFCYDGILEFLISRGVSKSDFKLLSIFSALKFKQFIRSSLLAL